MENKFKLLLIYGVFSVLMTLINAIYGYIALVMFAIIFFFINSIIINRIFAFIIVLIALFLNYHFIKEEFIGISLFQLIVTLMLIYIVFTLVMDLKLFFGFNYCLLGFIFVTCIQVIFIKINPRNIITPLYFFIISIAIHILINNWKQFITLLKFLIISSGIQVLIGYFELLMRKTFYYSAWTGAERLRYNIMRVGSTAGDPNFLCFYTVPLIPIMIFLIKNIDDPVEKGIFKVILILSAILSILTFSRIGLIALLLTTLLLLFIRTKSKAKYFLYPLLFVSATLIIIYKFNINIDDSSIKHRFITQQIGIYQFTKNPVFGIGYANFSKISATLASTLFNYQIVIPVDNMNTYLEILCSFGIVGFFIFCLVIYDCIKKCCVMNQTNNPLVNNFIKTYTVCCIVWLTIAITLDGFYTPLFWLFAILPSILFKINLNNGATDD